MSTDDTDTRPTIETVLEHIAALGQEMRDRFKGVDQRLEELDYRLDRIESMTNKTRSEFLELRADLRDWKVQLKEFLPPIR
jgi:DNA repair ATPase RecN